MIEKWELSSESPGELVEVSGWPWGMRVFCDRRGVACARGAHHRYWKGGNEFLWKLFLTLDATACGFLLPIKFRLCNG